MLPSNIIVQQHFNKNRALANCLGMLGWSLGYTVGPVIIRALLEAYGWRGTLLLMSGLFLHRVPLALSFWPPDQTTKHDTHPGTPQSWLERVKAMCECKTFHHAPFLLFWWSECFTKFYLYAFPNHIPSYADHNGFSASDVTTFATLIYIFNTVFRVFLTLVSNFVNRVFMYSVGALFGVAAIGCMLIMKNYTGLAMASIFTGAHIGECSMHQTTQVNWFLFSGLCNTLPVVILVDFLGVDSLSKTIAILNLGVGVSSLIATPLTGLSLAI
jgi:MFS family permease